MIVHLKISAIGINAEILTNSSTEDIVKNKINIKNL